MPEWEAEHALTLTPDEFYARYGPYFPVAG